MAAGPPVPYICLFITLGGSGKSKEKTVERTWFIPALTLPCSVEVGSY